MNVFVESLKRLFKEKKIDINVVNNLFKTGKISEKEKEEILNAYEEP